MFSSRRSSIHVSIVKRRSWKSLFAVEVSISNILCSNEVPHNYVMPNARRRKWMMWIISFYWKAPLLLIQSWSRGRTYEHRHCWNLFSLKPPSVHGKRMKNQSESMNIVCDSLILQNKTEIWNYYVHVSMLKQFSETPVYDKTVEACCFSLCMKGNQDGVYEWSLQCLLYIISN